MVNSATESDLVVVVAEDTLFGLHDTLLVLDSLTHLYLPLLMVIKDLKLTQGSKKEGIFFNELLRVQRTFCFNCERVDVRK